MMSKFKEVRVGVHKLSGHPFSVPQLTPLEDALRACHALPLEERELVVGGKVRRLERLRTVSKHDLYLINFLTFEYAGPGRVRRGEPALNPRMGADEDFSTETAMLYDSHSGIAYIEANRPGMSSAQISEYLSEFSERTGYHLIPRIDRDVAAKLRRFETIKAATFGAMPEVTEADRNAGLGLVSFLTDNIGGDEVKIEVRAGRSRSASLSVDDVIEFVGLRGGSGLPVGLRPLAITGRSEGETRQKTLKLTGHEDRRIISLPVSPNSRKVPYKRRWKALLSLWQADG